MPVIESTAKLLRPLLFLALIWRPDDGGNALGLLLHRRVLRNCAHRLGRVLLMQPR